MSINDFFKPCLLSRIIISDDSSIDTTYSANIPIKGFLQPVNGNEGYKQGAGGEDVTARFFAPMSLSVGYGDKIIYFGNTYTVLYGAQPEGAAGVNHHKEILVGAFL